MLRELSRSTDTETTIPDVRAERCVHSLIEQASCRACVDACPTAAWVIDDEMLGIDASRCDGCDLCVAVCPEAAIVQRFRPEVRKTSQGNVALACCEYVPLDGEDVPRMPCLHAIGTRDLLRLARDEVQYLVTTAGDCDNCTRGEGERLERRLQPVNLMLAERGLPTIAHRSLDASRWMNTWLKVDALARQNQVSRRSFFRAAVEGPAKRIGEALERAEGRFIPPGTIFPRSSQRDRGPFVPQISPRQCSGCDACLRLCPHEAIRLEMEGARASDYVIDADRCSGCGICVDVCEEAAVSVERWRPVECDHLPLSNHTCHACGVPYHLPLLPRDESRPDLESSLCSVCSRTGHHKKLFQVLD